MWYNPATWTVVDNIQDKIINSKRLIAKCQMVQCITMDLLVVLKNIQMGNGNLMMLHKILKIIKPN